jgi:membrane-bound inhibitor of C-type lysozyme
MKTPTKVLILVLLIIIIAYAVLKVSSSTSTPSSPTPIATVMYSCEVGKSINAVFYQGETKLPSNSEQPPTPSGTVDLTFSDGSTMTLDQTISADGARYANADGSFVFWSKGNSALVLENNQDSSSYTGCIAVAPESTGSDLSQIYTSSTMNFSIRLPQGYMPDDSYQYQELGPGESIAGVKFTIPASLAQGTNLSPDTYLSVEELPKAQQCTATAFFGPGITAQTVTDGDTTYSVASSSGAAAGNRYDETVYALPGTSPCVAVRYFIHYGVLDNYPPGAVQGFDENAILTEFDAIRQTLTLGQ